MRFQENSPIGKTGIQMGEHAKGHTVEQTFKQMTNNRNKSIIYFCEYISIDMILNQDKLFSIYITMFRAIWAQTLQNLADLSDLSLSLY